jgi:hypothetical protein
MRPTVTEMWFGSGGDPWNLPECFTGTEQRVMMPRDAARSFTSESSEA